MCRATVYRRRDHWVCSGYGDILPENTSSCTSLRDSLVNIHTTERWCVDNLALHDDGDIIAEAIRNRTAIAVSDGSFKDTYGTAAWVLEGDSSDGRIVGHVIAPGNDVDHSAYRSELSGILAVMITVKHICEHHKIKEGAVELACDGLSAIDKAFSYVSLLHIDEPDFDLIAAIKHQWQHSPILWKVRHVRGHQDKHTAIDNLDRWSRLNVEMDQLAKAYIEVAKVRPRHFFYKGYCFNYL